MLKRFKILFAFSFFMILVLSFVSCRTVDTSEIKSVSVTYVYNNGEENKTEEIYRFAFTKPDAPKKDGYSFVGWCTDSGLENFYNFEQAPESDMVLYAKWEIDYESLLRNVSKEASLFNVKIKAESSSIFSSSFSQGSGFIYKYQSGYYYVLTNYHVVESSNGAFGAYYVYDVYGNEYRALKLAGDPAYDLAVLRFAAKPETELAVAKIDDRIPSNTEKLICISSPNGRFNSITLGEAARYEKAAVESESSASNISFDVLWLDCYAEHGSSGGAILDTDFDVVAITYAVASDKFGNFKYSLAVPAAKIIEFLNSCGLA